MLKGALIGIGISILGVLPPVLHFVTGPLGPFIGGFVGGSSARATPMKALAIGCLMGILGILPTALFLVTMDRFNIFTIDQFNLTLVIGGGFMAWIGALGTLGALLGGYASRRSI